MGDHEKPPPPPNPDRYGLTVSPEGHAVWLDSPSNALAR